jgi:hypothetical protein
VAGLGSQETLAKRRPSGKVPQLPSLAPSGAGPRGPALPQADSGGSRSPKAPPPCHGTRDGMQSLAETPFDATQRRGCCHLQCPNSDAFPALLETNMSRVSNVPPALRVDGTSRRNETTADHLRTARMRRACDLHVGCSSQASSRRASRSARDVSTSNVPSSSVHHARTCVRAVGIPAPGTVQRADTGYQRRLRL